MVGIHEETRKNLKWKGLKWMIQRDKNLSILRHILRHPIRHVSRYVSSLFSKKSHIRIGDFFLYGIPSMEDFHSLLREENTLFVLGFAYCQKPFECPSGRFSSQCIASSENPVCGQCFIGKCFNAMPKERTISLVIPTVHYIGRKVFEIQQLFPDKKPIFLMTACEMMLEMFGDFSNMANFKGIGVRLDGRICNSFRAFELSEEGVKPGLTVLLPKTERHILDFLSLLRLTF
jgi:hypothetical protein